MPKQGQTFFQRPSFSSSQYESTSTDIKNVITVLSDFTRSKSHASFPFSYVALFPRYYNKNEKGCKDIKTELFREIIKQREYVEEISCGEWADGIEECWRQEISILSEDIPGTIIFLKTECTASEYSWISEIIDDLAAQTQSRELIETYKSLMAKFPEECRTYNIAEIIQFAEEALE